MLPRRSVTTVLAILCLVGAPAIAKCPTACKHDVRTGFNDCKRACTKQRAHTTPTSACRHACKEEKHAAMAACRSAADPTPPGCGHCAGLSQVCDELTPCCPLPLGVLADCENGRCCSPQGGTCTKDADCCMEAGFCVQDTPRTYVCDKNPPTTLPFRTPTTTTSTHPTTSSSTSTTEPPTSTTSSTEPSTTSSTTASSTSTTSTAMPTTTTVSNPTTTTQPQPQGCCDCNPGCDSGPLVTAERCARTG